MEDPFIDFVVSLGLTSLKEESCSQFSLANLTQNILLLQDGQNLKSSSLLFWASRRRPLLRERKAFSLW